MCGILVWLKKNDKINQTLFKESLKLINHRGPDSQKLYLYNQNSKISKLAELNQFQEDNNDYNIAFGSTRFGTYDSNSRKSDMPMIYGDGNYVISFNGDVYNFRDLKKEMIRNGKNFQTEVDTEVLLQGLIYNGVDFLHKINSDYAFVFLDNKKKQIIFSRDTFGAIPLFYYIDNDEFIISSEIRPIKKILEYKKNLKFNIRFYDHYLATNEWLYDENSNLLAFEEINSVEPGSINFINIDNFKIIKSNKLSIQNLITSSPKLKIDELEYKLVESIKYRLFTDKNLALFLSGGLDSSLILCLYKKYLKNDFPNLDIFTSENFHNDLQFVKLLAKDISFDFNEIKIGYDENIFDVIDDITLKTSLPASTYGNSIGQYIMFKKMKELNKGIIITGHGGDQMFSGLFSHSNASVEYLNNYNFIQAFFHAFLSDSFDQGTLNLLIIHYWNQLSSLFNAKKKYEISQRFSDDKRKLRLVKDQQINDILSGNFATSNNLINFISMSNSVAVRSPLIDRSLIGFINNNLEDKFKFGYDRYALRKIIKKYENNVHKRKQKQGLRWRGKYLLPVFKERIIETIKSSSFYNEKDIIKNAISKINDSENYTDDVFLKYYSLARFEKLVL